MITINAQVNDSIHRLGYYALLLLVVGLLAVAVGLQWWQYGLLTVLAALLCWLESAKPKLRQLFANPYVQEPLWEALVAVNGEEMLWQFYVHKLQDFGACVVLDGYVVYPMREKVRFIMFADMLSADDYSRLRALARFGG